MSLTVCNPRLPLVAILRGLEPVRAVEVARVIVAAGFEMLEVTMNSPQPFQSISALAADLGDKVLVGGGTMTDRSQIDQLEAAGGQLVVSPHCDRDLIGYAAGKGMHVLPGVLTPSEMFAAIAAGASGLKVFPAELCPPAGVRAVRAVLPRDIPLYMVGGIGGQNMGEYLAAGATGFGIGGSLFKPGKSIELIAQDARAIVASFHAARARVSSLDQA